MKKIELNTNTNLRKPLNRRDFLKLLSLLPASQFIPAQVKSGISGTPPNVILLVYDAWTSSQVPLYGYPRDTMPLLTKLAENAVVYHNHYSGGIFTYPGTASLLTGSLPWQHKAYYYSRRMDPYYRDHNLYTLMDTHHRLTYTHNTIARLILEEMAEHMDGYHPHYMLFLKTDPLIPKLFSNDYDNASVSWQRSMKILKDGYANSLFFSRLMPFLTNRAFDKIAEDFPHGLPAIEGDNYFLLEDATDWIHEQANKLRQPYFCYFHLLPPHAPYHTRIEYFDRFKDDGKEPAKKPDHIFSQGHSNKELLANRKVYDEYLLYVDQEFNRLYQNLERDGALENTWIILTSDHGEIFERGLKAHGMHALFDPLIKIPLLIFPPGHKGRVDIHTPTSAVDILPTILDIVNNPGGSWLEGSVLPPFNQNFPEDRPVFSMDSRYSDQSKPFTDASVMIRKGRFKLIYSFGTQGKYSKLNGQPLFELFDVENDPEELVNLIDEEPQVFIQLRDELFQAMAEKGQLA